MRFYHYMDPRMRLNSLLRFAERHTKTDMTYFARSGAWSNLSSLTVTLFSFVLYLAFAHFLSKETYGTYQYLLSIATLVGSLTLTGMSTSVARSVANGYEGALKQAVRIQLKWAIVPAVAALIGSAYCFYSGSANIGIGLILIAIGTPLIYTFNLYSSFLLGKKDFRRGFIFNLCVNVPFYGSLILVSIAGESPLLLLAVNLAAQAIGYYFAYRATLRVYRPRNVVSPGSVRYGAHLSIMGTLNAVANQLDSLLVFHILGPAQLAIYSFATAIPDRLSGLLKFIPSAALPRFAVRSEQEVRAGIKARIALAITGILLCVTAYAAVAPFFYKFFFPAYVEAAPYSALYALTILGIVTQIILAALSAHERIRPLYAFNTIMPILQIGTQVTGMLIYGLWGLIIGKVMVTIVAIMLSSALLLWRKPV